MSTIAIRVDGLSKQYRLGKRERYRTIRDTVTDVMGAVYRRAGSLLRRTPTEKTDPASSLFWALQDVSFEVPHGAVLGVIGRNGAGKSTLLKILSRITEPTEGRIEIQGRVGSLLEVGTGFHPELSGRENMFLNGAILGMKRAEIVRKFDEIVAFAEVDKFIDTPVKHYSSGMYMRLAFAVAAHLEPEILIIDEVLAVGDAQFQKKCLGKIGDVAKQGRTVLFVSHNMIAVSSLCTSAICLSGGRIVGKGSTANVVGTYLSQDARGESEVIWSDPATAPGNQVGRLSAVRVRGSNATGSHIQLEDPIHITVEYVNDTAGALLNLSLFVRNAQQVCVFTTISPPTERGGGRFRETCEIPGGFMNTGLYQVDVMLVRDTGTIVAHKRSAVSFELFETNRSVAWYGEWEGLVRPRLSWRSEILRNDTEDMTAGMVL